ncbi:MAG: type VII secretion protein EccB [Actinomycetota bacterium]|nr:type VII secretion protein EccB [Actinomycetota bacterium]
MSTNPTTKAQVQAYRFVLRRMESALVRKDAVMLHEPMRHHLRATAVGLILGLLGLAAFVVIGKLHPPAHTSAPAVGLVLSSGAWWVPTMTVGEGEQGSGGDARR